MIIKHNSVKIGFTELFDLLYQRDRDLHKEVLEILTEVAQVAIDTSPFDEGYTSEEGISWNEDSIQFAFAEVA
tara:strand:- start:236 stop:454 length:219 start_codon:yes stop_codon:yes gene_type:complete